MAVAPAQRFPHFAEWEGIYKNVRDMCAFGDALEFFYDHPGAVNNRGGRSQCTILHQAFFWGVDVGVLEKLKDLGADPTVLDNVGNVPLDMCKAHEREEMEARFLRVFGPQDGQLRQIILQAAKVGNFLEVMHFLRQKPYLVHTQNQHNGWSVMHQVAYHGGSAGLVAALSALGATWDLRTNEGKTPAMILQEMHPGNHLTIPGRDATVRLEVGSRVLLHSIRATVEAVLESVSDQQATVRPHDGESMTVPLWRISPVQALLNDLEVTEASGVPCVICSMPVPPRWKLSPACSGEDHPMCGDCVATFLWSQFTSSRLPIRCSICTGLVDLSNLPAVIGRGLFHSWPPGSSSGFTCTTLSWPQFVANVQEKLEEGEQVDNDAHKLRLQGSGSITLAYCDASAPGMRACPRCGVLIEYGGACKHFSCALCQHRFCWLCLRTEAQHTDASHNWQVAQCCTAAPVQSVIPHM
ncbi:unnamed protein product [Polarella glacialis]|uniref:RBR-type E3 ubiquitin transferase n=2 Tax=Polarella glacialis TaxID=89957 RepID=A0A813J9Y3_POLGL|nr:unnamed protein product [Polarella glacialis]